MADTLATLNDRKVVGNRVSLRADEGDPFHVGHIRRMGHRTTFMHWSIPTSMRTTM